MTRSWPLWILFLIGCILIFYRAMAIPITHDEASTWINYRHLNVWSCLSNYFCWGSANNHWLNTLLLQMTAGVFGEDPWAIRLPNVLAGFLYLAGAMAISRRYIDSPWLQIAGMLVLSMHVYLLDFFSLARGYGLMVCGVLWGAYGLMRYIERYELRWLIVTVGSSILAILANFTALLPWATLGVVWLIWLIAHQKGRLILRHGLVWLISAVLLGALLYFPIKILYGSGEFDWGVKNPWYMMIDLMINLLYNSKYINHPSTGHFVWALAALVVLAGIGGMLTKHRERRARILLSLLIVCLSFVLILLQQTITGAQAPVGRKTIYLIPIIFLPVTLGLDLIRHKILAGIVGVLVAVTLVVHGYCRMEPRVVREWYYDAGYPALMADVFPEGPDSDSVRLGSSWIFYPALSFYQQTDSLPFSGLEYQKQLVIDTTLDYYYLDPSDTVGLKSGGYDFYKKYGHFLLFKRSATVPMDTLRQE